jgi:hypothetical protein
MLSLRMHLWVLTILARAMLAAAQAGMDFGTTLEFPPMPSFVNDPQPLAARANAHLPNAKDPEDISAASPGAALFQLCLPGMLCAGTFALGLAPGFLLAWSCARPAASISRHGAAPRDTAPKEEESHEPLLQEAHEPMLQQSPHGTPEIRGRLSRRSNTAPSRLVTTTLGPFRNDGNLPEPNNLFHPSNTNECSMTAAPPLPRDRYHSPPPPLDGSAPGDVRTAEYGDMEGKGLEMEATAYSPSGSTSSSPLVSYFTTSSSPVSRSPSTASDEKPRGKRPRAPPHRYASIRSIPTGMPVIGRLYYPATESGRKPTGM